MINKKIEVESYVLREVTPTCDESLKLANLVTRLTHKLNLHLERQSHDYIIELEGSFAKRTNMKGSSDVDMFILLEEPLTNSELKEQVLPHIAGAILDLGGDIKQGCASHPYLSTVLDGFSVDIVPAVAIDSIEDMYTAVDRTPLHTRWVLENLTDSHRAQVRIMKQFLKNHGLYGSSGFSGYLCEVLISYFDTFWELADDPAAWNFVPDPVDSLRNVAAEVSDECKSRFIFACMHLCMDLRSRPLREVLLNHFFTPKVNGF